MAAIDWLDISTAPRTGESVLPWTDGRPYIAGWRDFGCCDGAYWSGFIASAGGEPEEVEEPTHWAPISPPG